ncbi:MAG: hypothetical protein Q9162_006264 [Coniocarpon cinnabarinum]
MVPRRFAIYSLPARNGADRALNHFIDNFVYMYFRIPALDGSDDSITTPLLSTISDKLYQIHDASTKHKHSRIEQCHQSHAAQVWTNLKASRSEQRGQRKAAQLSTEHETSQSKQCSRSISAPTPDLPTNSEIPTLDGSSHTRTSRHVRAETPSTPEGGSNSVFTSPSNSGTLTGTTSPASSVGAGAKHAEDSDWITLSDSDDEEYEVRPKRLRAKDIADMRCRLQYGQRIWNESRAQRPIHDIFKRYGTRLVWNIRKMACVAVGSLAQPTSEDGVCTVAVQLAFILELRQWIYGLRRAMIPPDSGETMWPTLYAQDPSYTDLDKQLYSELGIQVIEGNGIWNQIDDTTLVFGPFFPTPALTKRFCRTQFEEGRGAAAIIWTPLNRQAYDRSIRTARFAHLCKNVEEKYRREKFPCDDEHWGVRQYFARLGRRQEVENLVAMAFRNIQMYFREDLTI